MDYPDAAVVVGTVVGMVARDLEEICSVIKTTTNKDVEPVTRNYVFLNLYVAGCYVIASKYTQYMTNEEKEKYFLEIENVSAMILSRTFKAPPEQPEHEVEKSWKALLFKQFGLYRQYSGNIVELLRDTLQQSFSDHSKIKFMENKRKNRWLYKTGVALAVMGGNQKFLEEHKDDVVYDRNILQVIAQTAVAQFLQAPIQVE